MNIVKKLKYSRLSEEERIIIDLLDKCKEYKKNNIIYYYYNNVVYFEYRKLSDNYFIIKDTLLPLTTLDVSVYLDIKHTIDDYLNVNFIIIKKSKIWNWISIEEDIKLI